MAFFLLIGCNSLTQEQSKNMLGVAPQSEHDVIHPHWNKSPIETREPVSNIEKEKWVSIHKLDNEVIHFLNDNRIGYQVFDGDYPIIKLERPIHFDFNSSTLSADANQLLILLAQFFSKNKNIEISLEGHTDYVGSERFNTNLSLKRADAVKNRLLRHGAQGNAIYTRGYADLHPHCTKNDREYEECNRRVEILFIVTKPR